MPDGKGTVRPVKVINEAMGEAIGRLLEIDRERDVVAKVVRGSERCEKSMERDGSVVGDDRDVDSRSVEI